MNEQSRKDERRSRFDRKKKFKKVSSATKLKETKRNYNKAHEHEHR